MFIFMTWCSVIMMMRASRHTASNIGQFRKKFLTTRSKPVRPLNIFSSAHQINSKINSKTGLPAWKSSPIYSCRNVKGHLLQEIRDSLDSTLLNSTRKVGKSCVNVPTNKSKHPSILDGQVKKPGAQNAVEKALDPR